MGVGKRPCSWSVKCDAKAAKLNPARLLSRDTDKQLPAAYSVEALTSLTTFGEFETTTSTKAWPRVNSVLGNGGMAADCVVAAICPISSGLGPSLVLRLARGETEASTTGTGTLITSNTAAAGDGSDDAKPTRSGRRPTTMGSSTWFSMPEFYFEHQKLENRGAARLTPPMTLLLRAWMALPQHWHFPYPTDKQRRQLAKDCNMTETQIGNWFRNERKRVWLPLKRAADAVVESLREADAKLLSMVQRAQVAKLNEAAKVLSQHAPGEAASLVATTEWEQSHASSLRSSPRLLPDARSSTTSWANGGALALHPSWASSSPREPSLVSAPPSSPMPGDGLAVIQGRSRQRLPATRAITRAAIPGLIVGVGEGTACFIDRGHIDNIAAAAAEPETLDDSIHRPAVQKPTVLLPLALCQDVKPPGSMLQWSSRPALHSATTGHPPTLAGCLPHPQLPDVRREYGTGPTLARPQPCWTVRNWHRREVSAMPQGAVMQFVECQQPHDVLVGNSASCAAAAATEQGSVCKLE